MTTVAKHEVKRFEKNSPEQSFNPATDAYLASKYSSASLAERVSNKAALQKAVGLPVNKESLLLTVCLPFQQKEAKDLLQQLLPALTVLPVQLVILQEDESVEMKQLPAQVKFASPSLENLHLTLGGSDAYLFLAKAKRPDYAVGLSLSYGAVPIVAKTETQEGLLGDYDPVREKGAAFVYEDGSLWSIFAALVRAVETYKLSYDWRGIQRNAMGLKWPVKEVARG